MVERQRSYFTDDAIVDLTALIAFQNMSNKFNSALAVPLEGSARSEDPHHQIRAATEHRCWRCAASTIPGQR